MTAKKLDHAPADSVMCARFGSLESRTSTQDRVKAVSTHSVVLPPLYEDLNQTSSGTG